MNKTSRDYAKAKELAWIRAHAKSYDQEMLLAEHARYVQAHPQIGMLQLGSGKRAYYTFDGGAYQQAIDPRQLHLTH